MIASGSSTACVALGALTRHRYRRSRALRVDKLSNDGLFVFLRRTEADRGSPFGGKSVQDLFAAVHGLFHRLQFAFSSAQQRLVRKVSEEQAA